MAKLDKDLKKVVRLEQATHSLSRRLALPGLCAAFLAVCAILTAAFVADGPMAIYVVIGALIAGYMALNIGANDVANNMGPAVGSRALTMALALVIAAVCEAAGAILAGGDVVGTVSKSIITPPADMGAGEFMLVMLGALLASAIWVNLATVLNAPVSTTHAVVGAVLGGGIAASWVISPVMGGVVAAALLALIKFAILYRPDRLAAARMWVPLLVGLMAGVFTLYMLGKGLSRVVEVGAWMSVALALLAAAAAWALSRPWVLSRSRGLENRRKDVSRLFVPPLIVAAALLSFAHGANDVANAVGPLAAIVASAQTGAAAPSEVTLPLWVLAIGAAGIGLGLALFGPRLIRTVGEQITKLDPMRAWCVALSAASTVLVASHLGLPVSSTHIAIGGIFGVGLLREAMQNNGWGRPPQDRRPVPVESLNRTPKDALKKAQKKEKRKLVRRRHAWSIGAAWVITVPAAGTLSGLLYLGLAALTPG